MKLYQTFKNDKYFYWMVASNFLQAGGEPMSGELDKLQSGASHLKGEKEGKEKEKDSAPGKEKEQDQPTPTQSERPKDTRLLGLCEGMMTKRFVEKAPNHLGSEYPL